MYEAVGERKDLHLYRMVRSYDIKGTVYAPTGSAVKDQNSTNVSAKYDVTDSFSVVFPL